MPVSRLAALLLLALTPGRVLAEKPAVDCRTPSVFANSAVNVVILPYAIEGSNGRDLGPAAQRFTVLTQFQTLFSILKFGEVGVVRLVASQDDLRSRRCSPETVLAKLLATKPGSSDQVQMGHGLVLVWGGFYEEDGNLFVHTNVRFLRWGSDQSRAIAVKSARFSTRVPVTSAALPPQLITKQQFTSISEEFRKFAVFHSTPDDASPSTPFPLAALGREQRNWALVVTEARGEWMKLASSSGPSGWVHAGKLGESSATTLPIVSFVEGAVGYLRTQIGQDAGVTRPTTAMAQGTDRAFAQFAERGNPGARELSESPALAAAVAMRGTLQLYAPTLSTENAEVALPYFERAKRFMPYSANLRNLSLVTRVYLAYASRLPNFRADSVAREFEQATAMEPDNPDIVSNLRSFYGLLLASGPPPGADEKGMLGKEELSRRVAALQGIKMP